VSTWQARKQAPLSELVPLIASFGAVGLAVNAAVEHDKQRPYDGNLLLLARLVGKRCAPRTLLG
jgi:hypothetical protein